MDRDKALQIIRTKLTERRYAHTIRVTDTAIQLAKQYDVDENKAAWAGIFHDYAKFRPREEMFQIIKEDKHIPDNLLGYSVELWHGPVGAYLVSKEIGYQDEEVLLAIAFHTTGRAGMTALEKVVFLADYIEPGRNFPGVDPVRELAEIDLDAAVVQALINTIQFLMKQKEKIYPDTVSAYNDLIFHEKNRRGSRS